MMKTPVNLSHDELSAIVSELLRLLYAHQQDDGTWCYATDKQWSGGDVCEALALLLDRFGLVPEPEDDRKVVPPGWIERCSTWDYLEARIETFREKATGSESAPPPRSYDLVIDGPALRAQRKRLVELVDALQRSKPTQLVSNDEELLDGLVSLTDEIADQAAGCHGIDCLLPFP